MSILKKLLNKSLYQTGGVKPKQTSSYTPSKSTVKVVDPKTSKPLYYDPIYDALFDPTTGNQLDSDDHRDIREVGKGGNRVKQAALVQNKRNELQTKGITSEYASRYRPGESEKIVLLLNSRFRGAEQNSSNFKPLKEEKSNTSDYATSVDGSDITSKADYIVRGDYLKDNINDAEVALKMQFGLPQTNSTSKGLFNNYVFDISDDRPTIGAQRDYYFKPIMVPVNNKNQEVFDRYIIKQGKDLPIGKNKVVTVPYAHMGNSTISHGINEDGVHYAAISDDWDLDPQKGNYGAVNLLPNSVYYNMLDKIGFPKSDQKLAVERFKAGDDLATILKYNNAKPKEGNKPVSGGIPIYYRSYYDEKTGEPVKIKNKFTSGGTPETQLVLPKKVVKLDGKYIEVDIDANKKPIFATKNDIDVSKLRKTTLGDEYDLEGTTYLLNSEEPTLVKSTKPINSEEPMSVKNTKPTTVVYNTNPVVTDNKTKNKKENIVISTFKVNKEISLPTLNTNTPIKEYQERIGVPVTGVLDEKTISTFETLVTEGMKSKDQKVKNYTLNTFYKNAPEELKDKAKNISYLSYAPMLGLDKQSKEAFAKDFSFSYTRTNNPPAIYKEVLKKLPYLQQYIDIEKSKSAKSYAYGGYTRRFI